MAGDNFHPEEMRERAEFRARVAQLREISTHELLSVFDFPDLCELAKYQEEHMTELDTVPYPEGFTAKYEGDVSLLSDNTSTFDDELEDALMEDPVTLELMKLRKNDPNNKNLAAAIRARRSTVVSILTVMNTEPCEVKKIRQTVIPEADDDTEPVTKFGEAS